MTEGRDLLPGASKSYAELARSARLFGPSADDDPGADAQLAWALEGTPVELAHRAWDWRDHIELPRIRNQRAWNACFSFATAAMIEARHRIKLARQTALIAGYVHNCILGITDPRQATGAVDVLDGCRDIGIAEGPEEPLPVRASTCGSPNRVRIAGWEWIQGRNGILNDLVANGPLVVSMFVGDDFFEFEGSGIYQLAAGPSLLHAVLLVGYDVDGGWALVQNSGGADWGVGGVGKVRIGSGGLIDPRSGAAAGVD